MIPTLSFLVMVLSSYQALAQTQGLTVGLNALGGKSSESVTTIGAVANRKTADQLYQQSLADEKAAWSTFPPNVGLLSKALKEAQDGVKADDQSHYNAQQAMKSTETGANAGKYDAADYNAMGVPDIQKMATSSSPLWPQVASKLKGYGMSLTEDKQFIQTPFGKFPTDATADQAIAVIKNIAGKFGLSGDSAADGIKAAEQTTANIAQRVMADVKAKAAQIAAKKGGADTGETSEVAKADDQKDGRKVASDKKAVTSVPGAVDWDEKARQVNAFRDQMQQDMDMEPIWTKDDDIFKKVHEHYVMLEKQNVFLPASATSPSKLAATP